MGDFDRVLVANRGEIAVRVIQGCQKQGLSTVAVFSEADADLPHVRAADLAVHIGPAPAAESYLNIEKIIAAAKKTGAQAIHPGYGFLSENAEFAEAVEAAGLVFIGPTAASIRQMGSKARARELMAARGVPVVPGYGGADQSDARLIAAAEEIGFPVLVKAAAGGGGKGMSIVRAPDELTEAIAQARRLARSAFGDDTLVIERYLDTPRHVEVQILGDGQGNVVHFFERECSIQRRFQKIIEEAPSPALDEDTRQALCAAGVEAGKAINYRNAGTVEFILDAEGRFYFLEVNTRLQVEHPVTEQITGVDLVGEQIAIARGEPIRSQASVTRAGHAIECRLYAEDPAHDFLPSVGALALLDLPQIGRVDAGFESGNAVSVHYDPLLAKLIATGPDRGAALRQMRAQLRDLRVAGVTTNQRFLAEILTHPAFVAGDLDTHFIATHFAGWGPADTPETTQRHAIAATLAGVVPGHLPGLRTGFRNNHGLWQAQEWQVGDETIRVEYRDRGDGRFTVRIGEAEVEVRGVERRKHFLVAQFADALVAVRIVDAGETVYAFSPGGETRLDRVPRFPDTAAGEDAGGLVAPMPGKVVSVAVAVGDAVTKGDTLVVIEAMKMEQRLTAPHSGVVEAVRCAAGELVDAGVALVVLSSGED